MIPVIRSGEAAWAESRAAAVLSGTGQRRPRLSSGPDGSRLRWAQAGVRVGESLYILTNPRLDQGSRLVREARMTRRFQDMVLANIKALL